MRPFHFTLPTRVAFGAGAISELSEGVKTLGPRAVLVTGHSSMRLTGVLDKVMKILEGAGVRMVVSEGVDPNPRSTYIDEMAATVKQEGCAFVIGLGGGSAMDAAKAIAFVASNGGSIVDYMPGGCKAGMVGVAKALPIVAITTTAGTGSEVTRFAVITNPENRQKPGIGHTSMYPFFSVVDPELHLTLPREVTAATGVDVLFHALEAILSNEANSYSDLLAEEALRLTVANLETACRDGGDIEARTKMAWANTLAGMAIDSASTVAIHGIGHSIGGHTDSAHGETLAVLGPAYLGLTYKCDIFRYARVAELLGLEGQDLGVAELAERSSAVLRDYLERVGVETSAARLGVTPEVIDAMIDEAFFAMEGCMNACLMPLSRQEACGILEASL